MNCLLIWLIHGQWAKEKGPDQKSGPLNVVPLVGFELTTYRLQGGCSTN
jgi:hypothetical protein